MVMEHYVYDTDRLRFCVVNVVCRIFFLGSTTMEINACTSCVILLFNVLCIYILCISVQCFTFI